MRKAIFFVLTLSLLLVAGSCKLFSPVDYSTAITVNGKVTDQTGAPVADVSVILTGASGTQGAGTDASGVYHFADVKAGKYTLTFEKAGYARVNSEQLTVDNSGTLVSSLNLTTYAYSENLDAILYEETATLTGRVYYGDASDQRPAVGATVRAYFTYGAAMPVAAKAFADAKRSDEAYVAVVAADGSFSFSPSNTVPNGLPRAPAIYVYVEEYTVGTAPSQITYAGREIQIDPFDFSTTAGDAVGAVTLSDLVSSPFLLTTGLSSAFSPNAGTIVLNFSRPVVPGLASFSLFDTQSTPALYCNLLPTWAADALSVTLKPAEELLLGDSYTLHYSISDGDYSASGDTLGLTAVSDISLVASSVDTTYSASSYDGYAVVAVGDSLVFTYSVPVAKVSNLSLYSAGAYVECTATIGTTDARIVTVAPAAALTAGARYTVGLTAISGNLALDADSVAETRVFYAAGASTATAATSFRPNTSNVDYDDTSFTFTFNEPANAVRYEIQARYYITGTNNAPWQLVKSDTATLQDYYDTTIPLVKTMAVDLSTFPYFDVYKDDAITTPWVGSRAIEFKLLTYAATGTPAESTLRTPDDSAALASLSDNTAPAGVLALAGGSPAMPGTGTVATAVTVNYTVTGVSEYLQTPTVSSVNLADYSGTAPTASNFAWTANPTTFTFSVTFPSGCVVDTATDFVRLTIRDQSGNAAAALTIQ